MSQPFNLISVLDDKLVVEKLRVRMLEGNVTHYGNLDVKGGTTIEHNLSVKGSAQFSGEIEVDTLKVKNLITETASQSDAFTFQAGDIQNLNGKGLLWHEPGMTHQFVFKAEPRGIFSTENINLHRSAKYQIDGKDVLDTDRLGPSVIHSNLKSVGALDSLRVNGETILGEAVYVNPVLSRLGINTSSPNASLSIVDNSVEIVLGAEDTNTAFIGTWGPKNLNIITDNTTRISIKGNAVSIGSPKSNNASLQVNGDMTVNGTLTANTVISDIRIERSTPIEFLATADSTIYGKGLLWKASSIRKSLVLLNNPDRIAISENIDLAENKSYMINGQNVLSSTSIGDSVTDSNLTKLGNLENLTVVGDVNLCGVLNINNKDITVGSLLTIADGSGKVSFGGLGITSAESKFEIKLQETVELSIDSNKSISIGSKDNTSRTVNLYGNLAINITNPDPQAAMSVNGMMVINNKKIITAMEPPSSGTWSKGDIAWNQEPNETGYVGWVCVVSGTPGTWKPFGYIGEK